MTLNVNLVPVDDVPARKALGNSRAAEYDRLAATLKANPGQAFRVVERTGTQSNVNALKARGIGAWLRNTDDSKKGDLFAKYIPGVTDAPKPVAEPAPAPQSDSNPTTDNGTDVDHGTIAGAPVDADGMPVTS